MTTNINIENRDVKRTTMSSISPTDTTFVTINEMAKIAGIGHNRIRKIVKDNPYAPYIHMAGTRVYLVREMFTEYLINMRAS